MLPKEFEHVLVEEREIRRYDVFNGTLTSASLGCCDDVANQRKIEERFAALKFKLDRGSRRSERQIECPCRGLRRHVITFPVGTDARHLAIVAGVLASERHDENVKVRETGEK